MYKLPVKTPYKEQANESGEQAQMMKTRAEKSNELPPWTACQEKDTFSTGNNIYYIYQFKSIATPASTSSFKVERTLEDTFMSMILPKQNGKWSSMSTEVRTHLTSHVSQNTSQLRWPPYTEYAHQKASAQTQ